MLKGHFHPFLWVVFSCVLHVTLEDFDPYSTPIKSSLYGWDIRPLICVVWCKYFLPVYLPFDFACGVFFCFLFFFLPCKSLFLCSQIYQSSIASGVFSYVQLLATPWTLAHQAPPSMGFSRHEYWSGVPLPSPSDWTYYYGFSIFL